MARNKNSNQFWLISVAAVVLLLIGAGVYFRKTIGLRNALSTNYWKERAAGHEFYNPEQAYFNRGSRDYKDVVLTIDDVPHRGSMDTILDVLKRERVPATFFAIGLRVKQNPDLIRRMIDEGHEVGNHTQDHIRLDTLTEKQVRNEIVNCEKNVEKASGRKMTLLRPPGMRFNQKVLKVIKELGYTTVGWNVGAKDFIPSVKDGHYDKATLKAMVVSPQVIAQRVLKQIKNGSIILLHDNPVTAAALPEIIEKLKSEGYTFRTTAEMLERLPDPVTVVANPPARMVAQKSPQHLVAQ